MNTLPRLVYLASRLRGRTPAIPRELQRYLPWASLLDDVARYGLDGAASLARAGHVRAQLTQLAEEGAAAVAGEPEPHEFRLAVVEEVFRRVAEDKSLRVDQQAAIAALLHRYLRAGEAMLPVEEETLGEPPRDTRLATWPSGFAPLDLVTGGLYQGLLVFLADTGVGKTTHMLLLAAALKATYPRTRITYFSLEIPVRLLKARLAPLALRGEWPFDDGDRLISGALTSEEIVRMVARDGPRDQVVFVDTPDAMPLPGDGENLRLYLAEAYRDLVQVKEVSRLVVTASQVRRGEETLGLQSVSEAYDKVRYADLVVAIQPRLGMTFRLTLLKNRFGAAGKSVEYELNLATLEHGGARPVASE